MTKSSFTARFDKSGFTGTVLLAKNLGDRVAGPVGGLGFSRFFVSFFIDWKKEKPVRLEDKTDRDLNFLGSDRMFSSTIYITAHNTQYSA